jgi:hypothetical protein
MENETRSLSIRQPSQRVDQVPRRLRIVNHHLIGERPISATPLQITSSNPESSLPDPPIRMPEFPAPSQRLRVCLGNRLIGNIPVTAIRDQ